MIILFMRYRAFFSRSHVSAGCTRQRLSGFAPVWASVSYLSEGHWRFCPMLGAFSISFLCHWL